MKSEEGGSIDRVVLWQKDYCRPTDGFDVPPGALVAVVGAGRAAAEGGAAPWVPPQRVRASSCTPAVRRGAEVFSYDDDAALRRPLRQGGPAPARAGGSPSGAAGRPEARAPRVSLPRAERHPDGAGLGGVLPGGGGLRGFARHLQSPKRDFRFRAGSLFQGSEIANRTRVSWGSITVAYAELLLLRAALADARNERFLLVSESCVPVHPFLCLWDFLFATDKSLVKTWKTTDRASLYDFADRDAEVKRRWRKGHQWVGLTRRHAALVATSADWYAMFFDAHARTPIAAEFRVKYKQQHPRPTETITTTAGEHLVQTVLALGGAEPDLLPASPTLIRFGDDKRISGGAPRRQGSAPPGSSTNIHEAMNSDWRATSYDPSTSPRSSRRRPGHLHLRGNARAPRVPGVEVGRGPGVLPLTTAASQAACRSTPTGPRPASSSGRSRRRASTPPPRPLARGVMVTMLVDLVYGRPSPEAPGRLAYLSWRSPRPSRPAQGYASGASSADSSRGSPASVGQRCPRSGPGVCS